MTLSLSEDARLARLAELCLALPEPRCGVDYHRFRRIWSILSAADLTSIAVGMAGRLFHFEAHQFRHTVGTRLVNRGYPHHLIQRYLGHESPDMTSVYAHLHDATLKREFARFAARLVRLVVHHECLAVCGHSGNECFIRAVDGTHRLAVVARRPPSRTHHSNLPTDHG